MKAPWHESQGLIPWMVLLIVFLIVLVGIKEGWIAHLNFAARKNEIDGVTKILGSVILFLGGILSYFRFFKGRTFRPKLNISPKSGMIPLNEENLHWIDVKIENRGSVSIWNHEITIYATLHSLKPYCMRVTEYMPGIIERKCGEHLIDVGEALHEHAFIRIPMNIHAVTYQIVVKDHHGTIWTRCLTESNTQSKNQTEIKQEIV
jgi:hypothetical protein